MELFLAQNHAAMTHLPIAASILTAAAAITALFLRRREVFLSWAILSVVALITAFPTVVTGIAAARGRTNDKGKAYIQEGLLVDPVPQNTRILRHQVLAIAGTAVAAVLSTLAVALFRGRSPNPYATAILAVLLSLLWGIGGHLGGEDLWGPDTFPAFRHPQPAMHDNAPGTGSEPGR